MSDEHNNVPSGFGGLWNNDPITVPRAEWARLQAIVETLPKDTAGKPITVGAMVTVIGTSMGDSIDDPPSTPGKVVSVCCDHVWVSWAADDQDTYLARQCTLLP